MEFSKLEFSWNCEPFYFFETAVRYSYSCYGLRPIFIIHYRIRPSESTPDENEQQQSDGVESAGRMDYKNRPTGNGTPEVSSYSTTILYQRSQLQ